jgi:RNA polymerase sigma factor (TIGR02999 family)
MGDVTQILADIESGDSGTANQLLPLIYDELRRLAATKMAGESPDHTLQATALVHEAYVRLVDVEQAQQWNSRGHFYIAAGEAMRRILVESARRRQSTKRGGDLNRVELEDEISDGEELTLNVLALDEALAELESKEPDIADLVKLRFFCGLPMEQAASSLGISSRTAYRNWDYARALLFRMLGDDDQ